MKKIIIALAVIVAATCSTIAQTTVPAKEGKVCKPGKGNTTQCYATNNAKNYKVCKGNKKYYTCGKLPATGSASPAAAPAGTRVPDAVQDKNLSNEKPANNNNEATKTTSSNQGKVCKQSSSTSKPDCYNTAYAENFAVCQNSKGYYICGQNPNAYNATFATQGLFPFMNRNETEQPQYNVNSNNGDKAPQNQSYKNINTPQK